MARLKKKKVLLVLGTRPEAIKLAPVVRALRSERVEARIALTGQHRELLEQVLESFELSADRDLKLMRPGQEPADFAARALPRLVGLLRETAPDLVVVQGDTTTAACGALAAFYSGVPVAHVEAGLRTYDAREPFPEELNRCVIDAVATLLFAPTAHAARALRGRSDAAVVVTGNTVIDSLKWTLARRRPVREPALARVLERTAPGEPLLLATLHRREALGPGLLAACAGLRDVLERERSARLIFPVHLNPRVQRIVRAKLRHERAHLLPPLDYPDLLAALQRCRFVLTDSGGLQEEAPALGKPVLILRRKTERPEAVSAGAALVVGLEPRRIAAAAIRLLRDERHYARMARKRDVFGDGRAAERIACVIRRFLEL